MKATGITRKVDELGRIVLPKELREQWILMLAHRSKYLWKETVLYSKNIHPPAFSAVMHRMSYTSKEKRFAEIVCTNCKD